MSPAKKEVAPRTGKRRARGEGSILYVESKKRYRARVDLGVDPVTGKRVSKDIYGVTKNEVVTKMNALKVRRDTGGTVLSSTPTVAAWLDYWLENIDVKPRTWAGYSSQMSYVKRCLGRKRLDQLQVDDVRKLHADMAAGRLSTPKKEGGPQLPLSPTTINGTHRVLRKALQDAILEKKATYNVCDMVKPPSKAVVQLPILDFEQAATVLQSVQDDRLGSRWAAALLTGARQGELLGLQWDRVDFEKNQITFSWQLQRIEGRHGCGVKLLNGTWPCGRLKGALCPDTTVRSKPGWESVHLYGQHYLTRPKTRDSWRVIPLVEPLRSFLLLRQAASSTEPNPHNLVWTADKKHQNLTGKELPLDGKGIDPARDNRAWHAILTRAGVPQMRLHDARRTAVTLLHKAGVPLDTIKQIVGHSNVLATLIYLQRDAQALAPGLELYSDALGRALASPAPSAPVRALESAGTPG